jgi:hypothetical protein
LKPSKTWKANCWRTDLRSYTRDFQKKFSLTAKTHLEPGEVYAATYRISTEFPTDKHHFTPVFASFGRFRDEEGKTYVRGLNLFYLKPSQKLEILDEFHSFYDLKTPARVSPLIKIHEKWMKIAPYAFKNYEERRIMGICKIDLEDWGMIPLLREYLYGTFNAVALNEDFQKEIKEPKSFTGKKTNLPESEIIKDEEEVVSDSSVMTADMNDLDFDLDSFDDDI